MTCWDIFLFRLKKKEKKRNCNLFLTSVKITESYGCLINGFHGDNTNTDACKTRLIGDLILSFRSQMSDLITDIICKCGPTEQIIVSFKNVFPDCCDRLHFQCHAK